ncbi:ATP-binding protein [Novosphingobium sp. AP12]|uniref:ATP-binding protein n=1 Tax=Novosphingobium sp. AP12 TaxID=1144305 RepID=UPI000271D8B6|nr:ATP-binding protein [Novosphingobium sp. AP12]EJL29496.1 histidine kinase [Novosphingobium sp. AP12]
MKHKSIDLASEVKRATLPDGLQGFLFPLFEAVSNALHSIEERWQDEAEENGQIEVEVSFADQSITIADNGTGFDQKNLDAFLTPLTGNKFERGGKGFGRFIAFKLFDRVFYSSRQTDPSGATTAGTYRYEPFAADDNLIPVASDDGAGIHRFDLGLTARMQSPNDDVSNYFDPTGDRYPTGEARDAIALGLVDHFLVEFIQKKVPKKFSLSVDGIATNLYDHFYASLSIGGSQTEQIEVSKEQRLFEFNYFKVSMEQAKKHRLYFYANNRAASDLENISPGLNDRPFDEEGPNGLRKYYYLVAVSSDFFVSSQSRDKIINLNVKPGEAGRQKTIRETLIALAKQHILELESEYTAERRAKMVAEVEHLIAIDPLLRRGLGSNSPNEFVRRRTITETREQLARDLFLERFRTKFDFTKLKPNASIDELVEIVKTKIPEDAKEALAVYVAYRNHVIQIFRALLKRTEDGLATEDKVHQLIYPRYKDSEDVDYSAHNLWLLDDDLAYAQYISSDRTPDGSYRAKGEFAHDILINNENELMIVEMKRPQKTGYSAGSESPTDHPVTQLKNQITSIRRKGRIKTSEGREIQIPADRMVRGYILADWNDQLQEYLASEDFVITNYGGQMAYRYYQTLNLMLEVIAFDRLVDRASNRNDAFVQILDGRSTYDRKPTGALGG